MQLTTKDLYTCEICHKVTNQTIITERVDKKEYSAGAGPHPCHVDAKHGQQTSRQCKCGCSVIIKYESDCRIGYCGIKKIHYGGGYTSYKCSCGNTYSYSKR